jgi:hypothetical protein
MSDPWAPVKHQYHECLKRLEREHMERAIAKLSDGPKPEPREVTMDVLRESMNPVRKTKSKLLDDKIREIMRRAKKQ